MVVWCKYCSLPVDVTNSLQCQDCKMYIHLSCLKEEKPSSLKGDMLFDLLCKNCGGENGEELSRMKITWVQAIHLALYNLAVRESGRQGFFKWKDDVCGFISQNWNCLFPSKPMTNNWRSTVAGTLSVYSQKLFKSGQMLFNETGWWSLIEVKPPPRSYGENIKAKGKPKSKDSSEAVESVLLKNDTSFGRGKRKQKQPFEDVKRSKQQEDGIVSKEDEIQGNLLNIDSSEDKITDFSMSEDVGSGNSDDILNNDPFSLIKVEEIGNSISRSLSVETFKEDTCDSVSEKSGKISEKSDVIKSEIVTKDNDSQETTQDQAKTKTKASKPQVPAEPRLVPMNPSQENELLYRLNCYPKAIAENSVAKRLQRKLKLRKLKREMGLPIFDLDEFVRERIRRSAPPGLNVVFTDEYGRELPKASTDDKSKQPHKSTSLHHPALQGVNVLERFQTSMKARDERKGELVGSFLSRLVGRKEDEDLRTIVSPYTHRLLKPYIRRDYDTKPLKLRVMDELLCYTHRFDHHWIKPCPSPIDYCYVQPHHIPAVNAMCQEFFWRGIDLSECLQYPDFSCVVLYRKLVIGFAFMVPDVKYNEAYISFVLVHPDWQKAGIGTFMIYHLIQTCMGKDVTLHVSASNPSMLLYQKFGFKAEEYILDFYDKYLPEHSNECRHAFFLRLQR